MRNIKKNGVKLGKVCALLGIKRQYLTKWRTASSTLTKDGVKYNTIINAGNLFGLSNAETEELANKAGLSLQYHGKSDFIPHIGKLLSEYTGKLKDLYETAFVSERMFRYMKQGKHLKKEPLLAILIALNRNVDDIQECLKRAGYILSKSLPEDAIITWILKNETSIPSHNKAFRINSINDTLHSFNLPLLMTRIKTI